MTAIRRLIGTQIQRDHALRTTWQAFVIHSEIKGFSKTVDHSNG